MNISMKNNAMTNQLTDEQVAEIAKINAMEHYDMCSMWRFAPSGHPYFDSSLPFHEVFRKRLFEHFGGFTPEISKSLSP
jgi:hypothetical protein